MLDSSTFMDLDGVRVAKRKAPAQQRRALESSDSFTIIDLDRTSAGPTHTKVALVGPSFETVVRRLLQPDPDKRLPSTKHVLKALAPFAPKDYRSRRR